MDFFAAQDTIQWNKNMLLKLVVYKTAFVKFKLVINLNQNIDETDSKQPKIHREIHTA